MTTLNEWKNSLSFIKSNTIIYNEDIICKRPDNMIKWSIFDDKNVALMKATPDGTCFFHSILLATNDVYYSSSEATRKDIAYDYRKYLGNRLSYIEKNGISVYDTLSRGTLKEFSKVVPEYSIDNLKSLLYNTAKSVGQEVIELVSNDKNIDIYIIDNKGMYYYLGDRDIYYKNRKSVVLFYTEGHYDLLVYKYGDTYKRLFNPDDDFIIKIKSLDPLYFNPYCDH
jgi:hypothetical protein